MRLLESMENVLKNRYKEGTKTSSGHPGKKQLAAARKDGRPYACGYAKKYTLTHT